MKAWTVATLGEPTEVLELSERPSPEPGPGQVHVRVRATAANFPDVLMIKGLYQVKPPLPFVPGDEICGDVIAVGAGGASAGQVTMSEGGAVTGRIIGVAGAPLERAEAVLYNAAGTVEIRSDLSDASGVYSPPTAGTSGSAPPRGGGRTWSGPRTAASSPSPASSNGPAARTAPRCGPAAS